MSDTPTILAQAQAALDKSLAQLPEGKRGALAAVVTTDGARVAFVERINSVWSVAMYAAKPWDGPLEAGAVVLGSWR